MLAPRVRALVASDPTAALLERSAEVAAVEELLAARSGLLVVEGPAGIGKTRTPGQRAPARPPTPG
jgi:type II secretory ATPase GspE/PulE/Tfp pilus assembly ATPase PilB-like protein